METVQPIRDRKKIDKMKKILAKTNKRDMLLFVLGINSGLRISDILNMKVEDVLDEAGRPKQTFELREKKTGKVKRFILNDRIQKAVKEAIDASTDRQAYLFASRKGNGPISRQQAWRILNEAARAVGIKDKIGTHTLRKTFGYFAYGNGTDLTLLQQIFNHAAPSITLKYIGITQDEIDDVYINISL